MGKPRGTGKFEKLLADTVIMAVGQMADTGFLRNIPGCGSPTMSCRSTRPA